MEASDRKNEVETKTSEIKEIDVNLNESCKSICKIIYQNNFGTGFFIKLYKDEKELLCLMSNEHVITKDMIESKATINIKYNYEKKWIKIKLDEKERFIKYDKEMDFTIVEIKPEDKIKDKYFLLPCINDIDYKDKDIYIVQYPEGKNLSYSQGKIKTIDNYELSYDASTKSGSSGSPILLKNTTEVIGIHKQGSNYKKENYGTLINSIERFLNYKKIVYSDGKYYIGELLNNQFHGKGILYYKDGKIEYDGDFIKGKREGKGKYIYEDGQYYIGQWVNNFKHGKGIEYYKNGTIKYVGDFNNGKLEGYGKYIYEDGEYYIGQWLNNLKHGKGILYHNNGTIWYDGEWVENKKEGNGKFTYENGNYYIGQWMNNKEHGKGKFFDKNNNIQYEGDVANGSLEGKGKFIYENGNYFIAEFLNGSPKGIVKVYDKNGNFMYDAEYDNEKAGNNFILSKK